MGNIELWPLAVVTAHSRPSSCERPLRSKHFGTLTDRSGRSRRRMTGTWRPELPVSSAEFNTFRFRGLGQATVATPMRWSRPAALGTFNLL